MSPRNRRDWNDEDDTLQKMLRATLSSPDKAQPQAAADNRLIAALRQPVTDLAVVKSALDDGANPDRIILNGFPALHLAVQRQDAALLELLIQYDAETADVDADGFTALDVAYRERFAAGVRLLTQARAPLRLTGCDDIGLIPEEGQNYQTRIDTAMLKIIRSGTGDELRHALALGGHPDAREENASPGYCALHLAIARCDVAKVDMLLNAGAKVGVVSGRGETSLDMLWWAGPKDLLGDDWHKIFKTLEDRGARTLFSRHPSELTVDDLRRNLPIGLDGQTNALHFLVRMSKVDYVMDIIRKDPEAGLTAEDLNRRSGYYHNETLLDAFIAGRRLRDLFTAEVWQGRLDEMMTLRDAVEKNPNAAKQVDFDEVKKDILQHRQDDLRRKAVQKDGLKLKPRKPPGGPAR